MTDDSGGGAEHAPPPPRLPRESPRSRENSRQRENPRAGESPSPRETPPIRATVCSGGLETVYLRAGQGRPVLLLLGDASPAPAVDRLLSRLAERFRVIRPTLPPTVGRGAGGRPSSWEAGSGPGGEVGSGFGREVGRGFGGEEGMMVPFGSWLRGFVDGLGLERCSLVADGSLAGAAAEFAFADPVRVICLVLLVRPERGGRRPAGADRRTAGEVSPGPRPTGADRRTRVERRTARGVPRVPVLRAEPDSAGLRRDHATSRILRFLDREASTPESSAGVP